MSRPDDLIQQGYAKLVEETDVLTMEWVTLATKVEELEAQLVPLRAAADQAKDAAQAHSRKLELLRQYMSLVVPVDKAPEPPCAEATKHSFVELPADGAWGVVVERSDGALVTTYPMGVPPLPEPAPSSEVKVEKVRQHVLMHLNSRPGRNFTAAELTQAIMSHEDLVGIRNLGQVVRNACASLAKADKVVAHQTDRGGTYRSVRRNIP